MLPVKIAGLPKHRILKAHALGRAAIEKAGLAPEAAEVSLAVEAHRWAWKPERPTKFLIAESHVFTSDDDLKIKVRNEFLPPELQLPPEFVRLVYCLGYGENGLLTRTPQVRNTGTWQYWNLFGTIAETLPRPRASESQETRLKWKVATLKELSRKGIWLLDSSLHGIYAPGGLRVGDITFALHKIWLEHYGAWLIQQFKPIQIWAIGKGVASTLAALGLKVNGWIYQPNARSVDTHARDLRLDALLTAFDSRESATQSAKAVSGNE